MRVLPLVLIVALAGCDALSSDTGRGADLDVRYVVEGDASVTYLEDGDLRQSDTRGAWEARFGAAGDALLSIEAVSIDGTPVRARIEVDGSVVRAGQGSTVRLDSRTDDRSSGEVEVHGPVEAVGPDRVTVLGRVFVIDGATRLLGRDNETVPASTFTIGTFVEAEGRSHGDGTFTAKKIKLDDDDGDDSAETEVEGRIEILDAGSITVAGTRFTTDPATRWLDDDGDPIARSAFAVGDRVEAEGHVRTGALYAEKVKLDDD